jgi:hypothetical protein
MQKMKGSAVNRVKRAASMEGHQRVNEVEKLEGRLREAETELCDVKRERDALLQPISVPGQMS